MLKKNQIMTQERKYISIVRAINSKFVYTRYARAPDSIEIVTEKE
jgi:hypothetical protein